MIGPLRGGGIKAGPLRKKKLSSSRGGVSFLVVRPLKGFPKMDRKFEDPKVSTYVIIRLRPVPVESKKTLVSNSGLLKMVMDVLGTAGPARLGYLRISYE